MRREKRYIADTQFLEVLQEKGLAMEDYELVLVEEYELLGEKRYRFQLKGTSVFINVSAGSVEEAREKAMRMVREIQLDTLLRYMATQTGQKTSPS